MASTDTHTTKRIVLIVLCLERHQDTWITLLMTVCFRRGESGGHLMYLKSFLDYESVLSQGYVVSPGKVSDQSEAVRTPHVARSQTK